MDLLACMTAWNPLIVNAWHVHLCQLFRSTAANTDKMSRIWRGLLASFTNQTYTLFDAYWIQLNITIVVGVSWQLRNKNANIIIYKEITDPYPTLKINLLLDIYLCLAYKNIAGLGLFIIQLIVREEFGAVKSPSQQLTKVSCRVVLVQ